MHGSDDSSWGPIKIALQTQHRVSCYQISCKITMVLATNRLSADIVASPDCRTSGPCVAEPKPSQQEKEVALDLSHQKKLRLPEGCSNAQNRMHRTHYVDRSWRPSSQSHNSKASVCGARGPTGGLIQKEGCGAGRTTHASPPIVSDLVAAQCSCLHRRNNAVPTRR